MRTVFYDAGRQRGILLLSLIQIMQLQERVVLRFSLHFFLVLLSGHQILPAGRLPLVPPKPLTISLRVDLCGLRLRRLLEHCRLGIRLLAEREGRSFLGQERRIDASRLRTLHLRVSQSHNAARVCIILEPLLQVCVLGVQLVDQLVVELRCWSLAVRAQLAALNQQLTHEVVASHC